MAQSILNSPGQGYLFEEGEHGGVWVEKEKEKYNPYAAAGKIRKQPVQGLPDHKGQAWGKEYNALKRAAPEEKGYVWSMGYNNLVGRTTQGKLFPDLSGSSLNRKNAKNIPATDEDLIRMADTAAIKYSIQGGHPIVEWDGKRTYFALLAQNVRDLLIAGDRESAIRLTMWLSASLGKLSRGLSFGVHVLSTRSRGKIKDKATAFFRSCPGNRVFATLTFIAPVDDRTGQVVLNKFLTQGRKKFPGLQYFWVAERQESGNIHFHMILNRRLPVGRWNALWVISQYNAGLVGHNQYGDVVSKEEVMRLYALDTKENFSGARSPKGKRISRIQKVLNPFDIKPVRSIGALSNYLTKYITKQEKNQPFGCSVWHCSRGVSRMFTRQTVGPSAFAYMKSFANYGVDKRTGEIWAEPKEYTAGNGFAVVVFANDKSAPLRYLKRMEQVNKWMLDGHVIDKLPVLDDELYKKIMICKN